MNVFVLLPCFNEQHSLPLLVENIGTILAPTAEYLRQKMDLCNVTGYRIVAVDDGSTDDTLNMLHTLKKDNPLTVLVHEQNRGLADAYRTLFQYITDHADPNDAVIMMDADSTHDPYHIVPLLYEHACKADVVIASRYEGSEQGVPLIRRILSKGINWLIQKLCQVPIRDCTSGYRCYRAEVLKELELCAEGFEVSAETLIRIAQKNPRPKLREIPMLLRYDQKQSLSKMNLRHTVKAYLKLLWWHTRINLTPLIQRLINKIPKIGSDLNHIYLKDPLFWNDGMIALAFLIVSFFIYDRLTWALPWYLRLLGYVAIAFVSFCIQHFLRRFWIFQK